mgnify:CR=1 FL=1
MNIRNNGSRAAQPGKPDGKSPDPYWSLWGKIKAEARRFEEEIDAAEGVNLLEELAYERHEESSSRRLLLPTRRIPVRGTTQGLAWVGPDGKLRVKQINSDAHAFAALRKLDTDHAYFADSGTPGTDTVL